PDRQAVLTATIDSGALGRVLDLRTDVRWKQFFEKPGGRETLEIIKSGRLNEVYGNTFENFLQAYKINRNEYDAIIGEEYVRGGVQLCIVHKNGLPTHLTAKVRALLKPVAIGPANPPAAAPPLAGGALPPLGGAPRGLAGKVLGNKDVAAVIGTVVGITLQWLGDKGIEREARRELETTHR